MAIQRQRIEIHSGLDGELFIDTPQAIGELVIAGKSHDFEWTNAGLTWNKEPPYRFTAIKCSVLIECIIEISTQTNSAKK